MTQRFELEINKILLMTGSGLDRITIHTDHADPFKHLGESGLQFDIKAPRGRGRTLLKQLGLKPDKVIKLEPTIYDRTTKPRSKT